MSFLPTRRLTHRFGVTIDGDDKTFRIVGFTVRERLSEPFHIVLQLSSRRPDIDLSSFLGKTAQLKIFDEGLMGGKPRLFNGVIVSFRQQTPTSDGIKGHSLYNAVVEPQLSLLRHTSDCRIFQEKSVRQIIDEVLKENDVTLVEWRLMRDLPTREFCCQYQESDLAFVHRLLAEEGIWYCFEHGEGTHTLILTDDNQSGITNPPGQISYNGASGGNFDEACITRFSFQETIGSGKTVQRDYTFRKPRYNLETSAEGDRDAERELYFYPGRYKKSAVGKPYTQLWLEQARAPLAHGEGTSNQMTLVAGGVTKILDYSPTLDGAYLIVGVIHQGSQPQAMEEGAGTGAATYSNSFTCIPGRVPYRPIRIVKPKIEGPQTAKVVGPPGEEIYTDEYGRVKVQFPWDRYGKDDEHSSCWIRVAHNWASLRWGHVALPRIGDEVLVEHLEGDIDQPVVTTRVYNALNMQPYTLPKFKTRMTIQSKTHKGNGYNELRFEDEKGLEEVYFQAEKYHNAWVKDDETWLIGGNRHKRVEKSQSESIGKDKDIEVTGEHREVVDGSYSVLVKKSRKEEVQEDAFLKIESKRVTEVGASCLTKVGENARLETGEAQHLEAGSTWYLNAGDTVVIQAGSEICLNVGGNFVKINAGGVQIEGKLVKVNCGGSPTAGTEVAPEDITPPDPYEGPHAERYGRSWEK